MNLQRLLIDRMENRILVGTTAFLAMMVLVGWVAINEPGRMAAFQQQHLARSVEKGAELYTNNCAECHGPDGLGSARAPALNNPQLFSVNFLAAADTEVADLETTRSEIESLQATLSGDTSDLTSTQIEELEAQMQGYVEQYGEDPIAALDEQIASAQQQGTALTTQMQSAIDLGYNPEQPSRLSIVDWNGTLEAFIFTTISSGRPVSTSYWPQPMPAWSQTAGGPLREDQIQDLTNYVLNWGTNREWTVEDLLAVNQFAKIPSEGAVEAAEGAVAPELANIPADDVPELRTTIDENITRVLAELEEVTGDPNNGQTLYTGALACAACHNTAAVAPPTDGTYTRAEETRIQDAALSGYTAEQYLVESILVPNAYIAPGYPANAMPQDFGARLEAQELADLMAFLESQDGPDPLAN